MRPPPEHGSDTKKNIYYYRCLGSDDYRYEGGRICVNKPVRADYLDTVVWDHITGLLTDPQWIRTEIDNRLAKGRTADPATRERKRLNAALTKTSAGIAKMIEAFGEQLITIDELRARMPDLRARETNLRSQIQALDNQLADREAYLNLAADLEGFLAQLNAKTEVSTVQERQRVLRLLVKDILIGPEKITIRHRIPHRERTSNDASADTEGEHCQVRWGRNRGPLRGSSVVLVPRFRRHFDFDNDTSPAISTFETAHRLPDPHLTHPLRLFRVAHHDGLQPTQHTAVWSLPPQGDSEGPNLHLSHSTASKNLAYITSSSLRS